MDNQQQALQAQARTLRAELDGILSAGDAVTDEQLARGEAINTELSTVKTKLDAIQSSQGRLAALQGNATQFDQWSGQPASALSLNLPGVGSFPLPDRMQSAREQAASEGRLTGVIVPARARSQRVKSFKSDEYGSSQQKAYAFGMFMIGTKGSTYAQKWCSDHGMPFEWVADKSGTSAQFANIEGVNTQGGFLVPEQFTADLIDLRETYGVFRREAYHSVMTSDTKSRPRRVSGLTPYFVGEAAAITESELGWDRVLLTARKLAVLSRWSSELNEDAVIEMGDRLADEISYAFALKEDQCGFLGDGTSTYGGIVGLSAKMLGLTGTIANIAGLIVGGGNLFSEILLTDFLAAMGRLPLYAANSPNTKWYMHRSTYYNVALRLALAAGGVTEAEILAAGNTEPRFLGYPVVFAQVLPSVDVNSQILAYFGDLSKAADFGDRRDTTIAVSDQRYFDTDELAIRGTERFDIVVHDVGNFSATAGLRAAGPIVGVISAAS